MRKATILSILVAAVVAVVHTAPASAHVYVSSRTPGKGATVSTKVSKVQVTFTKQIVRGSMTVKKRKGGVVARGGKYSATGVRASTGGGLSPGRYKVTVRLVAGDGHSQTVRWSFRVRR